MKLEELIRTTILSAFLINNTACAVGLADETSTKTNTSDNGAKVDNDGPKKDNGGNDGPNDNSGNDAPNDNGTPNEVGERIIFRTNAVDCNYNKEGTWIGILTQGELKPYGYAYPGGNGPSVLTKIGHTPSVPEFCKEKDIYRHINTGDIYIPINDPSIPLPFAVFMEEGKKITDYMKSKGFDGPVEAEFADLHSCTLRDYMLKYQEIRDAEKVVCKN